MRHHIKIFHIFSLAVTLCNGIGIASAEPPISGDNNVDAQRKAWASVGCPTTPQLTADKTPVDLYRGLTACINEGNVSQAFVVYALAGTFGRYDTLRVEDESAHDAVFLLKEVAFSAANAQRLAQFQKTSAMWIDNPFRHNAVCQQVRQLGPPRYYPQYMIEHGMKAMSQALSGRDSSKNGSVPSLNIASNWKTAVEGYLHCPAMNDTPHAPTLSPLISQENSVELLADLNGVGQEVKNMCMNPSTREPSRSIVAGRTQIRLPAEGLLCFFESTGALYEVRVDAPFAGSINGIKIGDSVDKLKQTMGESVVRPAQHMPNNDIYIYYKNTEIFKRFDVSHGVVKTILIGMRNSP